MKKSSLKKIKIKKVEKYLKKNQYIDICNIIKNENAISIIAKFSFEILIKYLKICSKSKNIDLYLSYSLSSSKNFTSLSFTKKRKSSLIVKN
jgi:Tfp pilus assembly major pilin PilA